MLTPHRLNKNSPAQERRPEDVHSFLGHSKTNLMTHPKTKKKKKIIKFENSCLWPWAYLHQVQRGTSPACAEAFSQAQKTVTECIVAQKWHRLVSSSAKF